MDSTTPAQPSQQQQNFATDFWHIGQAVPSSSPANSAIPPMPAFFHNPMAIQRPPTVHAQSSPSSAARPAVPSSSSSSEAPSTFHPTLQSNRPFASPFDVFGSDQASTVPCFQHPSFRPPIGMASHFGPNATNTGHFAQNFPAGFLHQSTAFPSVVASVSVGFDCMGLMNNFGLNSAPGGTQTPHFAVPHTPPALQSSSSAALMPLAMSAIYASGGGAIQRSSSFLNNSMTTPANRTPLALGQSASTGALANSSQQQQPNMASQLFDLSDHVATAGTTAASVIAAAVSSVAGGAAFQAQQPQQIRTKSNTDANGLQGMSAFGTFSAKTSAEIAKIPKETATIPLESSREGTSSSSGPTEQRVQSQLCCQVCHLAASNGLHFGARTCAACAAFFRRSISDQKRYICKRSQRCVIRPSESGTQGYRKICRNCRMKRCLEIGMLPENVQNKRNKREYYFVDALHNAIQQSGAASQQLDPGPGSIAGLGIGGQQPSSLHPQQHCAGAKGELAKLLGESGGGGQQLPKLNPIEKFEPQEKESPGNASTGTPIGGIGQAQAFQPAKPCCAPSPLAGDERPELIVS